MTNRKRTKSASASRDEWYTPARIFDPLNQRFGFTVDAAATAQSAKCQKFYTKAENGLMQSYAGETVWCNPPYSNIGPWTELALNTVCASGQYAQAWALLLPCWTDRVWWHEYVEPGRAAGVVDLEFVRGRIKFGTPKSPDGGVGTGFDPSVIVIYRSRP